MGKKEGKKGEKPSKGKKGPVSTVEARPNPGATKKAYDKEVSKHSKGKKSLEEIANQPKTARQKIRAQYDGVLNKVRFAADTVVYAIPTAVNNYRSARAVRNNPNMPITYVIKGMANTRANQYRQAKAFRKRGYAPVITKTDHAEADDEKKYKSFKKQVKEFHRKARIKKAEARYDGVTGHSSGGNDVCYIATKKDAKKLGIKFGQAVSHGYYGLPIDTFEQKFYTALMGSGIENEDIKNSSKGRKIAMKRMRESRPSMDLETIAGSRDLLVKAEHTFHPYASKLHVIDHPEADHWGTGGASLPVSEIKVDLYDAQRSRVIAKDKKAQQAASYKLQNVA